MRYEKTLQRDNGDTVKIISMITSNVFVELGYELEQFAMVKNKDCEEWVTYYHQWSPKSIARKDYIENHKPKTFLGVVTIGEALKAGIEAKEQFFSK